MRQLCVLWNLPCVLQNTGSSISLLIFIQVSLQYKSLLTFNRSLRDSGSVGSCLVWCVLLLIRDFTFIEATGLQIKVDNFEQLPLDPYCHFFYISETWSTQVFNLQMFFANDTCFSTLFFLLLLSLSLSLSLSRFNFFTPFPSYYELSNKSKCNWKVDSFLSNNIG